MREKLAGVPGVFAGNEVGFFEDTQRTKRDVFEIAYRRRDDEECTSHLESAIKAEIAPQTV